MTYPLNSRFPSELRIRKSSDFKKVFEKGKKFSSEHYTIIFTPNSLGFPRLGLVVGKKRMSGAVKRNRVKRIVREVFKKNKPVFNSLDVLILPKKGSQALGYKKAEEEITETIKTKPV
ncbi:MAG TPA: ribonuclease P protein component [Thermodesulfobacteriota bacterium]|nr:ribonuclease P protein component [Thermodesulfobacteriota bacterium]